MLVVAVDVYFAVDVEVLVRLPAVSGADIHHSIEEFVVLCGFLQRNEK